MKLRLPFTLLSVLLGSFAVQGNEIPDGYEDCILWTTHYLDDHTSNTQDDYLYLLLRTDLNFTPTTNPSWTSSTPLVSGGNLIFTTTEDDGPMDLSFQDGQNSVFKDPVSLTFDTFTSLSFSNQTASNYGAAINLGSGSLYIHNVTDGVDDAEQADILFSGNKLTGSYYRYGGAIYANSTSSVIDISGNGDVSFAGNYASYTSTSNISSNSYGGAIYTTGSLSISNNDDISFTGNYASSSSNYDGSISSSGGAIRATGNTTSICNNGDVSFSGNYAYSENSRSGISTPAYSYGGAINTTGSTSICYNGDVSFSGNYAYAGGSSRNSSPYPSSYGGAIYTTSSLSISNNGDVTFSDNYAFSVNLYSTNYGYNSYSYGGAIYATGSLNISNNADVLFSGNYSASLRSSTASDSRGGAIYSQASLSIEGNDSVVFEKNYEKYGSTYRLRSLYMDLDSSGDNLILAARTGGHITFYDSVYKSSLGTVSFNADYEDANGITRKAGGDIIFSGQYTAEHLKEIKGGTAGTAYEITNSQTSEIYNLITLYGGSLQVVDGAKLNGRGLTVAADSGAKLLLRDGSMSHSGYYFTFNNGTTLELQGCNAITASKITMGSGSELTVTVDAGHQNTAALTLGGTDLATSQLTINLNRTDGLRSGMYKIISQSSTSDFTTKSAWTAANVTVNGSGYANRAEFGDLVWQNGTLYYSVGKNIWNNASGDCLWNTSSDNWTMNDRNYTYLDGMDVYFTDSGAGDVKLEGAVTPASIVVTNSEGCDYTFTAADSNGRLTGATGITKSGAGALTIATANEHTGNTSLQEGTINVHHSTALGATAEGVSTLTTAAGTTLRVGNNSHLVLAASNSLAGAVEVESDATLEMQGSGYAASASTVNGTLAFTGTAAATSNAGSLGGEGTVKVTDSQVRFESTTFTGNIEVKGKDASLELASGKYTGAGNIKLNGGALTLGSTANLTLNSGGVIGMSADMDTPSELSLNNLNIKSGAVLMTQAELQGAVSLNMDDVVGTGGTVINGAVGGVLDCNRVTLNSGSALVLDNAHFDMAGGALTLAVTPAASEKIQLVLSFESHYTMDSQVLLFSNLGTVNFIYDNITATPADASIYTLNAGDYFTGAGITELTTLVYDCGQNVLYLTHIVPEPATTTLSLLALAGLCARRRRR